VVFVARMYEIGDRSLTLLIVLYAEWLKNYSISTHCLLCVYWFSRCSMTYCPSTGGLPLQLGTVSTAFMLSAPYGITRPSSISLSVTRVEQSKTDEVRIIQFSPYSSRIPIAFEASVSQRNSNIHWNKLQYTDWQYKCSRKNSLWLLEYKQSNNLF